MKFIQKPSPSFEAFQWFKLGDGPEDKHGIIFINSTPYPTDRGCLFCGKNESLHGILKPIWFSGLGGWGRSPNPYICPGDWIAEITPGEWRRFTPTEFEDFYIPVINVENLVLEGLEKLGFSGLKAERK